MKSFILIFLLQFVVLIVVSQPVSELAEIDDTDNTNYGVHRYPRNLKSRYLPCKTNQYFDEDKGHCMSVIGGGRALYINNTKSCESNILIPHCTNPRYYYICKKDKIILAECSQKRHFDTHLQKCVLVPHEKYISAINRENSDILDSSQHFECRRLGSFPVPNNCGLFYTCSISGHRMHQNFYTCPKNMAYDTETELCKPSHTCHQQKPLVLCEDRLFPQFSRSSGEKKSRHCETIFTNEEETTTPTSHDDKILSSTTTPRAVPPISEFTGPDDNSDIITTLERAPEKSRSTNTGFAIRTTATIAEEVTTEISSPTVINDNGELSTTLGPSEDHTETTTNDSNEQSDIVSTILNDSTTPDNKEPEISTNEPSVEIPSSEEISQDSTTETESIGTTSSIFVDTETSSNTESEEQITETSLSTMSLEIGTTKEPNVENQTPSGSAENTTPSDAESNEQPILPTEPSLESPTDESDLQYSTTGESTTEINTASSSDVENESITEVNPPPVEISTEKSEEIITEEESITGIVPTEPSSEIVTPGEFTVENQEFTEESITETETTDITPYILNDSPLSSIEETNTGTDTNKSSSEITTPRKNSEDDDKESNEQVPNEDESTESSNNNWNGMITTESTSWISTAKQLLLQNDNTTPEINTEEIITEKPNSTPSDISSIDLTSVKNDDFDAYIESSTEPVKSSYKHLHSPITDTENVCNNVAKKEFATKSKNTHSEKTRSKNVALPLASAVSSIIDKIKHCLKKIFEELHH